ncbi:DUF721 domain-containing protein [Phreatobacter sp.]|uniref:DUF721 domain-containing protein n=1 Tax=Phreatobacter sp. TaxID=1966341 RepID=UPI003F701CAA
MEPQDRRDPLDGSSTPAASAPPRRRRGPRALADLCAAPLAAALQQAGFASAEVVTRWDEIIGPDLAGRSAPVRIAWPRRSAPGEAPEPGTLHVRVEPAFALDIQHLAPVIVERVNAFFGWRCVAALRLVQVPSLKPRPARVAPPPPPDPARLGAALAGIDDEPLRQAIGRLGAAIGGAGRRS